MTRTSSDPSVVGVVIPGCGSPPGLFPTRGSRGLPPFEHAVQDPPPARPQSCIARAHVRKGDSDTTSIGGTDGDPAGFSATSSVTSCP
ncbi:hypothetical protein NL676_026550 [Syzygium grande]|nr:hypothetical protein NL676_026550 [Syzygium grande]